MARAMGDGEIVRAFTVAVLDAAADDAEGVVPVIMAVAGGILASAEPGTVTLRDIDDGAGGVLWASFGGERMAFRYNPMSAMIELRAGTLDGHPLRLFGRRSLAMDITNFFGPSREAQAFRTRGR